MPPGETHIRAGGHPPGGEEHASGEEPAVMLRVAVESKLGLGPSDPVVRRRVVEPAPAKRARRRRH